MPPPYHPLSLPSPPSTDNDATHKSSNPGSKRTKSTKPGPKGAKRVAAAARGSGSRSSEMGDGTHKRVRRACERCRMKKTKCDGKHPCKRCRDDGLVCTAGHRKKAESKQLPRGYAEVLANTQYALVATVHKLYAMVLAGEQWTLDPPVTDARGQPAIHDIASKLGCLRKDPSSAAGEVAVESEERAGTGWRGAMGGILSVATGPESQLGHDTSCDDFEPGFEMDNTFGDADAAGYGNVLPFSNSPVWGFSMDGLQGLPTGDYEGFIPASSSSTAMPTAPVLGQMRLPYQLQLTPQQQQQQGLDFREQQNQWGGPALMRSGMYASPGMGGMGAMDGDGTYLLECGFGAGGGY